MLGSWTAYGGGSGWVGNSPMRLAYFEPQLARDSMGGSGSVGEDIEYNSLLLRPGESRLSIGFGNFSDRKFSSDSGASGGSGVFSFDYGISSKWSLLNLGTFAYSLQGNNGTGHEWAVTFGLVGGMSFSDYRGLELSPGIGLIHGKGFGKWHLRNSIFFQADHHSKVSSIDALVNIEKKWDRLKLGAQTELNRSLGEKWSLGLGVEAVQESRAYAIYMADTQSGRNAYMNNFIAPNVSAVVSRRLGEESVLSATLSNGRLIADEPFWKSGMVQLSTRW